MGGNSQEMSDSAFPQLDLLLAHRSFLRNLARVLSDPSSVDDIEQETWLSALRSAPRDPELARPWIVRVVRGVAALRHRERTRRERRERVAARESRVAAADRLVESEAARQAVVDALLQIEEPYREALILRFYEDLPPREIARRLGIPSATVRTRVRRGIDALRSKLVARGLLPPIDLASSSSSRSRLGSAVAVGALVFCVISFIAWSVAPKVLSWGSVPEVATFDPDREAPRNSAVARVDGPPIPRAAAALPAAEMIVTGRVFFEDTGAPVSGGTLRLRTNSLEVDAPETWKELAVSVRPWNELSRRRAMLAMGGARFRWTASVQTDGSFSLELGGSPPGAQIELHHPHAILFAPVSIPDVGSDGRRPAVELLAKPAGAIRGVVRDKEGQAVEGALVQGVSRRFPSPSVGIRDALTDARGAYSLEGLHPGEWEVTVQPVRHAPRGGFLVSVEARSTAEFDIAVSAGATARGKVRDSSGAPIPGVDVAAMPARRGVQVGGVAGTLTLPARFVPTDAEGTFQLEGLEPTPTVLSLHAPGWRVVSVPEPWTPGDASAGNDLHVVLDRGETLRGRIVVPAGLQTGPLRVCTRADRLQRIAGDGPSKPRAGPRDEPVSEDGTFEVTGLDDGPLEVTITEGARIRARECNIRVSSGHATIVLPKPATIRLRLAHEADGAPISDAKIAILRTLRTEDSRTSFEERATILETEPGRYEIRDLVPGEVQVEVHTRRRGRAASGTVLLRAEETREVDLAVMEPQHAPSRIAGRVVDAITGEPICGVGVEIVVQGAFPRGAWAFTDRAGRFQVEPPAAAEWKVSLWHERYGDRIVQIQAIDSSGSKEIVIPLTTPASARVQARFSDGRPAEGALLVAWPQQNDRGDLARAAYVGADGFAQFRLLAPGPTSFQLYSLPPHLADRRKELLTAVAVDLKPGALAETSLSKE